MKNFKLVGYQIVKNETNGKTPIYSFIIGCYTRIENNKKEFLSKSISVCRVDGIANPNDKICNYNEIKILFSYPLGHDVLITFVSTRKNGGFTRKDFWQAVHDGYEMIYAEEEEDIGHSKRICDLPGNENSQYRCINRAPSSGRHDIWGHDIGDLYIEGIVEYEPAKYFLCMGS